MPQEELISQYVDRGSFRSDTDFILSNLKEVLEAYKQVAGTKVNLSGAGTTAGIAAEAQKLNKETAEAIKLNEQLSRAELNAAKAAKEHAIAKKAEAQARKENATAAEKEAKATTATEKAQRNNKKAVDDAIDDYLQLSRAYNEAARKYKNYALTLGENHPVTLQALKDANDIGAVLKRLDSNVGQFQRNVGNYKSAFDGLGFSFTQISRELPSLAVNFQQFALAISNNLPMVADELKKASAQIKALKAEGKEAPSLLSKIGSAIFSWQVGLSIGITLFTAYGKEIGNFFTRLFDGKKAIEEAAASQQVLNSVLETGTGKYGDAVHMVNELQININLAKRGFLDKNEVVKQYNETIGKTTGEVKTLDQAEQALNKNADAFIKFTLLKAAAQEALGEASKIAVKRQKEVLETVNTTSFITTVHPEIEEAKRNSKELKQINDKAIEELQKLGKVSEATKKRQAQIEKDITESFIGRDLSQDQQKFEDIAKKFQQQASEIAKEFNFNFFDQKGARGKNEKFFDDELRELAEGYKELSKVQDFIERDRVSARLQAAELEQRILDGQRKVEIENAKGSAEEIADINQKFAFRKKQLESETAIDILIIRKDAAKRQRDILTEDSKEFDDEMKKRLALEIRRLSERSEAFKLQQEIDRSKEIVALNDYYEKQLEATRGNAKKRQELEEEVAARRAEIEFRYAKIILENEIQLAKDLLKVKEAAGEDVSEQQKKLAELELRLSDLVTKQAKENDKEQVKSSNKKREELIKDLQAIKQAYGEVSNFVTGIVGAITDRQKNAIQDQIDKLDEQKQKEIELVNQTVTNEQEKAAQIATINARAQAKKEELERRQRQLDIQRARFEKAANIGRIIIETALAVVKALPNLAQAAIVGAIGAAQLAVAIAQPIPKFKHGRDDGPATFGMVNDGGEQEVITSPDMQQAYLPQGTNTITYLPEHWKVFPDVDSFLNTARKMAVAQTVSTPVAVDHNGELVWMMRREMRGLRAAMMNRTEHHTYLDNGEVVKMIKNGNVKIKYIQDNLG